MKSPDYSPTSRRLGGNRFYKVLHYLKAKPYDQGLTLVSVANLKNDEINAIIEGQFDDLNK